MNINQQFFDQPTKTFKRINLFCLILQVLLFSYLRLSVFQSFSRNTNAGSPKRRPAPPAAGFTRARLSSYSHEASIRLVFAPFVTLKTIVHKRTFPTKLNYGTYTNMIAFDKISMLNIAKYRFVINSVRPMIKIQP